MGPLGSRECLFPGRYGAETLPACAWWEENWKRNQNVNTHQIMCFQHSRAPCAVFRHMASHWASGAPKRRLLCRLFVLLFFQDVTQSKCCFSTTSEPSSSRQLRCQASGRAIIGIRIQLLELGRDYETCITPLMRFLSPEYHLS